MDDTSSTSQPVTDLPQPQAATELEARASGSAFSPPAEPAGGEPPRREPVFADRTGRAGSYAPHLPLAELKRAWRIEEIIQAAGTPLTRASEDRLVGHCPFHEDRTPSFMIYLSTQRFQCYGRCHQHGDVLDFVQLVLGCSLTQAIRWLEEAWPTGHSTRPSARTEPAPRRGQLPLVEGDSRLTEPCVIAHGDGSPANEHSSLGQPQRAPVTPGAWGASAPVAWDEEADRQLTLTLATAWYAQTLTRHAHVLDYLRQRGISLRVARQYHLGYSDGRTFAEYCATDPSLFVAAQRCGLLNRAGAERFAGRLIVTEMRAGRTVWMIARSVPPIRRPAASASLAFRATGAPEDRVIARDSADGPVRRRMPPRYLGLTTPRLYLLGYGRACATLAQQPRATEIAQEALPVPGILVGEGALDYLIAQSWHLPVLCVALLGTHPSSGQLAELMDLHRLARGAPVLLALDGDAAGRSATHELARALASLGLPAMIVPEVPGAKDIGDLALRRDGRTCLLQALDQSFGVPTLSRWSISESSRVAVTSVPDLNRPDQPSGPRAMLDGNARPEARKAAEGAGTP